MLRTLCDRAPPGLHQLRSVDTASANRIIVDRAETSLDPAVADRELGTSIVIACLSRQLELQ
jgi:hypothetical protein